MRNTYLDPTQVWLEFSIAIVCAGTVSSGTIYNAQLDGSAHSLIKKLEVYSSAGSNLLESIDNYGALYHACGNVVGDIDDFSGIGSVTQGILPPLSIQTAGAAAVKQTQNYLSSVVKNRNLDGLIMQEASTGTKGTSSAGADGVYTFQLPLMALVGSLGDKYIPLHALAADLRVEITWQTGVAAFIVPNDYAVSTGNNSGNSLTFDNMPSTNVPSPAPVTGAASATTVALTTALTSVSYTAFNIFLHCGMVQISDDAQAAVDALTGGTFYCPGWHSI